MDGMTVEPEKTPEEVEAEAKRAEEDAEIVERAKECYRIGTDATAQWRAEALEDLAFLAGDQWDANVKGQRAMQGRPALTVNRLPQFVRQVTNEQRQSKPAVTVSPVDSGADVRTAEVLQGVIRNIEYSSNADAAYAAGGQSAAITGLGYWDVCAEYEDERSFEQRLTIRRISNPLSVVMDPGAKELAGDDARWVLISTDISAGEWRAQFPGREMPKGSGWDGKGDKAADWVAKDGIRVHEFRYIKEEPDTLADIPPGLFEDVPEGGPVLLSEMEPGLAQLIEQAVDVPKRPTARRKACFAKIAGDEVIERGELAGRYLQLVRVVGGEIEIDGRVIYEGVVRHAKDTQRMLNYFVSAEAEAITLAPKAPFIAAEGQIEGYEEIWEQANQRPISVLPFKPVSIGGTVVPPPQRVMAEANVQAITNARMQAADDLKAVTGIYDGQLGARSNETSGRAILARQSQGQTANFHFQDNLAMAIRYTGRILVDLIPKIYSGPRTLRILGEDGKQEMVPVNGQEGEFRGESAALKPINLDAGRYDVAVSMGPSYQSRRQEVAALLMELIKADPTISAATRDLLVKSMDIPGGAEIAKRLEKTLPPEIRPQGDKQPPAQLLAQQLEQTMQVAENLGQQLEQARDMLARNAQDNELKERIEVMRLKTQLAIKVADLNSKEGIEALRAELHALKTRANVVGINEPVEGTQPEVMPNG